MNTDATNKYAPSKMGRICFFHGRSGGIRTRDLLVPNQLRYQAALRSEVG
jgi:hypothetical protein